MSHYKLPLDDDVDKDILNWINKYPRGKKGEMVRHAIRYYMSVIGEQDAMPIKFPSVRVADIGYAKPDHKPLANMVQVTPVATTPPIEVEDQATRNRMQRQGRNFGVGERKLPDVDMKVK